MAAAILATKLFIRLPQPKVVHRPRLVERLNAGLYYTLTVIPENFVLILDDYPLVISRTVDRCLAFLLEHKPAQMHLVITTRENPSLPLARYRARDQLTELRAADLRFTPAEAAEFLNRVIEDLLNDDPTLPERQALPSPRPRSRSPASPAPASSIRSA